MWEKRPEAMSKERGRLTQNFKLHLENQVKTRDVNSDNPGTNLGLPKLSDPCIAISK